MFTINIYLKFALIALGLIGGPLMSYFLGFWYGFPFILVGLGMLASYIFLGTVQSTAQLVEAQDFDAATQRLNLTWKPEWLYATNRAYYYIMKGSIAFQQKDNVNGEMYFKKAQEIDLPSDNERAMIQLQLANVSASKKKWSEAKLYHKELKKLKVTEPQLKGQIEQFNQFMKQQGQMKHMRGGQGGGMMMGGKSKRRRPKMR